MPIVYHSSFFFNSLQREQTLIIPSTSLIIPTSFGGFSVLCRKTATVALGRVHTKDTKEEKHTKGE